MRAESSGERCRRGGVAYVTVEGFVAIGHIAGIECILGGFVG